MHYRTLGRWGVKLSTIGLGSWYTLGTAVDEENSAALLRAAYEAGINFFDTANVYSRVWKSGAGEAEILLGRVLRDYPRSSYILLTKVCGWMGERPNDHGLSAKHILDQCEASLRRLGTDYLDIYLCHNADPETPVDETVRAMDDLVRAGKVRYWGVSNWAPWRVVKAQGIARQLGLAPVAACEPRYNLLFRFPELELFPATADEGIGHVVFSPLAQGVLTGKYRPGEPPPPGTRVADPHFGKYVRKLYYNEDNLRRVQRLAALAAGLGITCGQLALAWALRHPQVTSVITGATRPQQIAENVAAAGLAVPAEVATEIETLFPRRKDIFIEEGEIPDLV
jgi:aryl-alcohol dehydrogenase-like predicted oxidoreductase